MDAAEHICDQLGHLLDLVDRNGHELPDGGCGECMTDLDNDPRDTSLG